MKNLITFSILFIIISIGCCKDKRVFIYLKNNSSKPIYYGTSNYYPDTNIQKIDFIPGYEGNISHKVLCNEEVRLPPLFDDDSNTAQVFIFDADVIEKNPWDSIIAHNLVLKRYQITEKDMERMDWTITYP
jgi:hypothetical protein